MKKLTSVILLNIILLSFSCEAILAQNNIEQPTSASIIMADSAQQFFIFMPQGTMELRPIELVLTVDIDAKKEVAHVTTNAQGTRISYTIYDVNGNALISDEAPAEGWDIDLSSLVEGQYILQAIDGKRQQRYRLLKERATE